MKNFVLNGLMEIARQTPFSLPLFFLVGFVITLDTRNLIIVAMIIFNMISNYIFKHGVKSIYKTKNRTTLPVLGRGYRPKSNMNCSVFGEKISNEQTFGMPSGHSQIIWAVITYFIIHLYYETEHLDNFNYVYPLQVIVLISIGVFVSFSRVFIDCHTFRQVLVGGLLGAGIGAGFYYMYPKPPALN
jgi:membrane-associated phospholipid phosphatase